MTHAELIQRGAKWLKSQKHYRYRSPIILTEYRSFSKEIPDILGLSHCQTTIIECKVSLEDFRSDLRKKCRQDVRHLGNWRFYLCPSDLIPLELVPEDWGLLYCCPNNIKMIRHPQDHNEPDVRAEEYQVMYSLIRRVQVDGLMDTILRKAKQRKRSPSNVR